MKRSISGIIRSELAIIENLQFNGYDLGAILQYLQDKHEIAEVSLNTFIVSLYRARKKHLKLGIATKALAKEINLNLEIPKKTKKAEKVDVLVGISADSHLKPTLTSENFHTNTSTSLDTFDTIDKMDKMDKIESITQNTQNNANINHHELSTISTKTEKPENQPKLLIKQVRDIFKSKTDISDLL